MIYQTFTDPQTHPSFAKVTTIYMYIYLNLYILFVHITLLHKHHFYQYPLLIARIYSLFFFFFFLFLLDQPRYGRRFREKMFFKRSKPLLVELYSISSTPFLALFFFPPPPPPQPSPPRTHFSPRRARSHSTNCI